MDPTFITPFIKSISNVFSTMLQLPVQVGEPTIKNDDTASFDVSGIIGMSGEVVGSVVLSFPTEAAERIVSLFTGEESNVDAEDFSDAVGELVNMIAGGAKGMFTGREVSISCPNVVIGANHKVSRPSEVPCVGIPRETDCGELVVEIAVQDRKAQAASSEAASNAA